MWAGPLKSNLALGTTLLLNCNKVITQNGFSSLSNQQSKQSIWGLSFHKKGKKTLVFLHEVKAEVSRL